MSGEHNKAVDNMANEIQAFVIQTKEDLESFRIAYLGSKNKLKDLFALMGKVPNEEKRNFGAQQKRDKKTRAWHETR